jgi:hypothetical protein
MKLKKFLKAADSRVCGGSVFQWDCFGLNAQFMDVSDLSGEEIGGCIFDRETQQVYQVEAYVNSDSVAYRWTDPEWVDAYKDECATRKVSKTKAYDDVKFTEVASEEDILDLLHRIVHNTYVHSKPIEGLTPASAWPFPIMGSMKCEAEIPDNEYNEGYDDDWKEGGDSGAGIDWDNDDSDEDGFDVDEFRNMAGVDHTDDAFFEEAAPQQEYEVLLTVKHRFTVKARNMEAACDKAKEFQEDMKSGAWPKGLSWEDRWVTKVGATKRLETTHIED